ncbi:RNA-directed DNA polymerase, partial [Streptococcus dysgalactiae]|uniref:RNA-directed DNA polymerase n=1 Tax=Streptococcus dysgalactiae TaxID=1334 RepID=UPI000651ED54
REKRGEGEVREEFTQDISKEEVRRVLRKMKNGKAVGVDQIPVEAWKSLDDEGVDILWDLMGKLAKQEKIPEEWRQSILVPIYKGKGDVQDCSNYRGIKLMGHTMKIWERVIDERIREVTKIGDEQFGFMPGRGTTDAIFALRQLMERCREREVMLHMVFIDLEKAYD